jgi:predicted small secreted protein
MRTSPFVLAIALGLSACGDNTGAGAGPDAATTPDGAAAPPGLTLLDYFLAVDVTPDGRTAVFEDVPAQSLVAAAIFYDTISHQVAGTAEVGDPTRDLATGVAANGRLTALHGDPVQAGAWTAAGGWLDIPSGFAQGCDADLAGAWDVSADGAVVVGLAWNGCHPEAFRWTDASGTGVFTRLQQVGDAQGGASHPPTNRATVISDDGAVIAGFAEHGNVDRAAAMWDATGAGVLLDPANTETPSEVLSISADGHALAGILGADGFAWTHAGGFVPLDRFASALPTDPVFPNAMTADGAVIFGGVGDAFSGIPVAFVWSAAHGMRPLADVATAAGVPLPTGTLLNSVLGASADGTVLIGTAMDAAGASKTFVLRLPAPPT